MKTSSYTILYSWTKIFIRFRRSEVSVNGSSSGFKRHPVFGTLYHRWP